MSLFWNSSDTLYKDIFAKRIELTVKGTPKQIELISELIKLIETVNQSMKENSGGSNKSFKISAIFLKKLLGEFYTNLRNIE